ncbi:MAG: FliG C-terminal domain-containing protein [Elusimicrobiota bacterium]|nr:FliG C-terminal domain-containing protein [Elusimicrobiota bacterium]
MRNKWLSSTILTLIFAFNFLSTAFCQTSAESSIPTADTAILLLEQERKYEQEAQEHIQKNILDRILGEGKSSVIVDVEFALETEKKLSAARERAAERKTKFGEIEYILPGIPKPAAVSQEPATGESRVESGETQATSVTTKLVIKKQIVTVLHDIKITREKLDIAKDAITTALKINTKRGDKLEFKAAKFTVGIWTVFLTNIIKPYFLLTFALTLLLLLFLFGPLSSFLKNYIRTLRERGGTEVTVDSKLEGGAPGAGGPGAEGVLSEAELAEKKRKEEESKEGLKYRPFSYVDDENLRRLIYLISKESPATIALVLSYLKPEHVREVLVSLPEGLQAEVGLNLATARQMTQEQVMEIDNGIKQKIDFLVGGVDQLLKVITEVDRITRNNILEYLKNEKPELYEKVRAQVFLFEDIINIPDQIMQVIIRELKIETIARALRNAPQEIVNKFFSNMSAGAVSLVKEEMEYGRPLTEPEIEDERDKIIETIKRLEAEGKIFIREKPKLVIEGIEETAETETPISSLEEYFSYAASLYDEGRYEESILYFEYCLQLSPEYYPAYQYLGNSYYALGKYQEALENFEKALSYNPEDENLRQFVDQFKASLVEQT